MNPPTCTLIRVSLKSNGAGVRDVEVIEEPPVFHACRSTQRLLRPYASPEGAAWFESLMAEFDSGSAVPARGGKARSTPS
ncbi:hypothetical protein V4F39_09585 [Aquincola sp. MAHUQ-54]|uniref:Uncharacterized protein n=1 Tax=Aquincola agrisoli TaxID=3119538 RepID=A0AAW9QFJ8_9BURK